MPFPTAARELAFFTGVAVSEATVRRQTEAAGAAAVDVHDAEVARLEQERPPAPDRPRVQLVSADGAMVPLVKGEWAEVKTVAVGMVEATRDADGAPMARTVDVSYFSRLTDSDTFGRLALPELHRRGTPTAGTVVAVLDGSVWLQIFIDLHRPDAVRILDFPHAVEYLSAAVQAALGIGAVEAAAWLSLHAHELKTGDPDAVLAALAALPIHDATDPAAAEVARDQALAYLTARREQIDYARFQTLGFPIGSGMIESANKLVVEARLKGAGMHWERGHVNPMLALRCIACNDRWGEAWPQIASYLRTPARARPAQRCRPRGLSATEAGRPAPRRRTTTRSTRQPSLASLLRPHPDHPKRVVDGRPTPDHPIKVRDRQRLARQPFSAKS